MAKANVTRQALVEAIAALESQHGSGDSALDRAVETALAAVRQRLGELQASPGDQQQRPLAVLVADLSGYTALSERMDAEKVRDALNAMWGVLDAVIAAYGGRIDQHAGDSLSALFGLPQPRGGDAARALRAALTMQTELALFNARVRRAAAAGQGAPWAADWPGPSMRVGVHRGPVYFAHAPTGSRLTAVGDTTAVARRLERAAPKGQVLASGAVWQETRAQFHMTPAPEAAGPAARRAAAEPAYLVTGERPSAHWFAPSPVAGQMTRLIGRTDEMDQLELALQATLDSAAPQVVTLLGAPGVGVSRLAHEFKGRAHLLHGALTTLHATAPADCEDTPYALVRDLLLRRFDIRPQHSRHLIEDRLRRGLGELDQPGRRLAETGPLSEMLGLLEQLLDARAAAALSPARVRGVVERLLGALTAAGPLLLVLDGLHRADRRSLELVEAIARDAPPLPVLFLGLSAAETDALTGHALTGDPFSPFTRLEVAPLSPVDSRLMATDILGQLLPPPMRLLDLVVAESGGNPLYVEAFIRLLMEGGVVAGEAGARQESGSGGAGETGRWRVDMARLEQMRLPAGLLRLMEARLAALPETERLVLQAAAAVGALFWDAALLGARPPILAGLSEAEIEAALLSLEAKRYIVSDGTYSFGATQAYAFRREITQQAAYGGLPPAGRHAQHQRVAQWLIAGRNDAQFGVWFPVDAMIARHFAAAGDDAQAAVWHRRAGGGR